MSPQQETMTLEEFFTLLSDFKTGHLWEFYIINDQVRMKVGDLDLDAHPVSAVCARKFFNTPIEATIDCRLAAAILGLHEIDSDALLKACQDHRSKLYPYEASIRSKLLKVTGLEELQD